jgi:hypothetical protein
VSKQDRQGVRTPADLERKYQFGKTFAEIMGLVSDAREAIYVVDSELRNEIIEQVTSITRDTERIVMAATAELVKTEELAEYKASLDSSLEVLAGQISLAFNASVEKTETVDGEVKTIKEILEKHFEFTAEGLLIRANEEEGAISLLLDNDVITFLKNGEPFGLWDGVNFFTGNIYVGVEQVAQFGNYGFVPFEDEETDGLDLVRVVG